MEIKKRLRRGICCNCKCRIKYDESDIIDWYIICSNCGQKLQVGQWLNPVAFE